MFTKSTKMEYFFIVLFLLASSLLIFKMVQDKNYKDSIEYFIGEGASMEPIISSGEEIAVDPNKKPEINDIIVFRCEKCKIESDDIDILTKRLLRENSEGCYWVEGDNKLKSYDSRNFGWLCFDEIQFLGTLIENDPNNKYN